MMHRVLADCPVEIRCIRALHNRRTIGRLICSQVENRQMSLVDSPDLRLPTSLFRSCYSAHRQPVKPKAAGSVLEITHGQAKTVSR